MFKRSELFELKKKAGDMANIEGLNPLWKRAYLNLADAADRLDAMIARTQEGEYKEAKKEGGAESDN